MDLLREILGAQNGQAIDQIAGALGLDKNSAASVVEAIAPALGKGLAKNAESTDGLDNLLAALNKGDHQRYLDNPKLSTETSGVTEGNKILGHILGSKDVSRQLASRASEQTGVGDSLIKKALPMLATLAMAALSKKNAQTNESGSALGGILGAFLGGNANNSMVDDLIGMAGKLLGR